MDEEPVVALYQMMSALPSPLKSDARAEDAVAPDESTSPRRSDAACQTAEPMRDGRRMNNLPLNIDAPLGGVPPPLLLRIAIRNTGLQRLAEPDGGTRRSL